MTKTDTKPDTNAETADASEKKKGGIGETLSTVLWACLLYTSDAADE